MALLPILIATGAEKSAPINLHADQRQCLSTDPGLFFWSSRAIDLALAAVVKETRIDHEGWACHAPYRPTPTIVEAARALYAQHSVEAIARYDAGAQNLQVTSLYIEELVID